MANEITVLMSLNELTNEITVTISINSGHCLVGRLLLHMAPLVLYPLLPPLYYAFILCRIASFPGLFPASV